MTHISVTFLPLVDHCLCLKSHLESTDVSIDWSDHCLWWPKKNMWLTRTRSTLNQYGVQADALLYFTPMHKVLRVQLPDLRFVDTKVDLSVKCFSAVKELCKELGIRHYEELSFQRPLGSDHLKRNCKITSATQRQRGHREVYNTVPTHTSATLQQQHSQVSNRSDYENNYHNSQSVSPITGYRSGNTYDERTSTPIAGRNEKSNWQTNGNSTLIRTPNNETIFRNETSPVVSLHHHQQQGKQQIQQQQAPAVILDKSHLYQNEFGLSQLPDLSNSPPVPSSEARSLLLHPKSLIEKARMNAGWFDSSLSLYEQDVREFDLILLRFKFFSFYDLNPKLDPVRINQIYEQARWSILSEEVDCTENEMMMFAALQVQAQRQAKNPNSDQLNNKNDDDIDAALNELQLQLEGGSVSLNGSTHHSHHHHPHPPHHHPSGNISSSTSHSYGTTQPFSTPTADLIHVPELADYLRFSKPRRFTLKTTKRLYFVFRDTQLVAFRTREDRFGEPSFQLSLRGCEITPDVNLSQLRYAIKLEVPHQDGMSEYNLRFNSEEQYAKWLAAFRLASKGKTMSDTAYESEVRQILDFLSIQHPAPAAPRSTSSYSHQYTASSDINPDDYVAPRFMRKMKTRNQIVNRILEAHANVRNLGLTEAKLQFIKAWQALPDYGVSLFVVKFSGSKKEVSQFPAIPFHDVLFTTLFTIL